MRNLTHKQRALLKVIEKLEEKGTSSKFMLVKTLFLLANEENVGRLIKFYNFFPINLVHFPMYVTQTFQFWNGKGT